MPSRSRSATASTTSRLSGEYTGGRTENFPDVQQIYSGDGNSGPIKFVSLTGGSAPAGHGVLPRGRPADGDAECDSPGQSPVERAGGDGPAPTHERQPARAQSPATVPALRSSEPRSSTAVRRRTRSTSSVTARTGAATRIRRTASPRRRAARRRAHAAGASTSAIPRVRRTTTRTTPRGRSARGDHDDHGSLGAHGQRHDRHPRDSTSPRSTSAAGPARAVRTTRPSRPGPGDRPRG